MKIDSKILHDIIDTATSKFTDQPSRLYWNTTRGQKEIKFEEKRIIAIIEAISLNLQLDLEIEYGK